MSTDERQHEIVWRVRLFDGPALEDARGTRIAHFRSNRVGALLAYLALKLGHPVPREELYDALWPEEEIEVCANRFRVSLASLRKQLEPPPTAFGAVLDVSEPGRVRLRKESVWVDTAAFDEAVAAGRAGEAAQLATGPLLPGYYDEWALEERERIEAVLFSLDPSHHPSQEAPLSARTTTAAPRKAAAPARTPASAPEPAHRLPFYLTRFFGREEERRQLERLIEANRLVSVTGPGGIGKTRMVVETARAMALPSTFVALADIAPMGSSGVVLEAVLSALGYGIQPGQDPLARIAAAVGPSNEQVLILDNAEHLLNAAADAALALLQGCPSLRIVITSRQRLSVPGEAILNVDPLDAPEHAATPERLHDFPSVALFADRAATARPDFVLSQRHTGPVADICRRLEGMPLALELAAARISTQTPSQIAASLAQGITELKSNLRGLSPRHRSLRAAMEGSIALLDEEQQRFFVALSVFCGGWTCDSARSITGIENAEELLAELASRSLAVTREDEARDTLRYAFLEPIRQFAEELLEGDYLPGTRADSLRRKHAEWYLGQAAEASREDVRSLDRLDGEQENLQAALEVGWKQRDELFWNGLLGYAYHAFIRGHHRAAVAWVDRALPLVPTLPSAKLRNEVRRSASALLCDVGRFEECTRIADELVEEGRAHGDSVGEVSGLVIRGMVLNLRMDYASAIDIHKEALDRARTIGDEGLLRRCLFHYARSINAYSMIVRPDDPERANRLAAEAFGCGAELLERLPEHAPILSLVNLLLFMVRGSMGCIFEGYPYLKAAQKYALAHRNLAALMYGMYHESFLASTVEDYDQSAILLGAFFDMREKMGYTLAEAQPALELQVPLLRSRLGEERYDSLVAMGRQMPRETLADRWLDLNSTAVHPTPVD